MGLLWSRDVRMRVRPYCIGQSQGRAKVVRVRSDQATRSVFLPLIPKHSQKRFSGTQ